MTKILSYDTDQFLACSEGCGDVIVCVDASLTVSGAPFINAKIVNTRSSCGVYVYALQYDETQLVNSTPLTKADVAGIVCRGCLTDYVDYEIAQVPVGPEGPPGPPGVGDCATSILTYGAVGDGITNDCDAFREAIASTKHICLPEGTFLIEPTAESGDFMLYLGVANGNTDRSGMTIEGAGPNSVIKLGDNVGAAKLLFGSAIDDPINDMTFRNFTIDLNGQNNLQVNFGDPLRYNSAFYLFSKCTNIKFENLIIKNGSGSQLIRVGDDTADIGKDITLLNCTFDTFGTAITNNHISDVSVTYIEASNVRIEGCTFRNPDDTVFNLARGQTAIELHTNESAKVVNNTFEYLQLPIILASPQNDIFDTIVHGNNFYNTNYLLSFDPASTGNAQSRVIISDNTFVSQKVASVIIPIGATSEGARTREQILFSGNIVNCDGSSIQNCHLFRIENTYLNNLVIQDNDVANILGCLVYFAGPALPDTLGAIRIEGNKLDSLGSTSGSFPGSPCFALVNPTSNTLASLVIDSNEVFNTAGKNYSGLGIWRRGGNITYCYINDTKNHVSSSYPLITGTLGTNTFKWEDQFPKNQYYILPYNSGYFSVGSGANVNVASFSALTVNDYASYHITINMNNGVNNGVAVWEVGYTTTGSFVQLVGQGGTVGANIEMNFSGSTLRIKNTSGGSLTTTFTVESGRSTKDISWLQ